MLRIGEFVQLSSISISMLRHYDKIGLLVPQHTDAATGYRYYDKAQLVAANRILAFKRMGLSLDEIRLMLQSDVDSDAVLAENLSRRREELETVRHQISEIEFALQHHAAQALSPEIVRKEIHPMWVVGLSGKIASYPQEGQLWAALGKACAQNSIPISAQSIAMSQYQTPDENDAALCAEVQFSLDRAYPAAPPIYVQHLPARNVASVIFRGTYAQIGHINVAVAQWLETNRLAIDGRAFSIYHKSPGNCAEEKDFITELCFPVQEI